MKDIKPKIRIWEITNEFFIEILITWRYNGL